jgi:hypothetical protein
MLRAKKPVQRAIGTIQRLEGMPTSRSGEAQSRPMRGG